MPFLSSPDLALAEPYHPQHTSALAPGMIPAPSRLLTDTKGWPGTENPAVSHLVCEGDQLLLKATQTCRSQGAISSPASPQEAEQGPHSVQFVASSCIRVLTQRNLLIREGSGGSCPAFPQCHKDNRRKHSPLLSSKPPAPLISLPTFSSGSSRWWFHHHHSRCHFILQAPSHGHRHNGASLEKPLLGLGGKHSAPRNKGSATDNQEKMHRCLKTQRVSIREHRGCILCCVLLSISSTRLLGWVSVQGLRCPTSPPYPGATTCPKLLPGCHQQGPTSKAGSPCGLCH